MKAMRRPQDVLDDSSIGSVGRTIHLNDAVCLHVVQSKLFRRIGYGQFAPYQNLSRPEEGSRTDLHPVVKTSAGVPDHIYRRVFRRKANTTVRTPLDLVQLYSPPARSSQDGVQHFGNRWSSALAAGSLRTRRVRLICFSLSAIRSSQIYQVH